MKHEHLIRPATPEDAAACAAIYAPYVRETTISFEEEPPTPDEMATRMASAQQGHAWLVLEDDSGRVVGYAYGNRLGVRAAYRWSCEVSVYLDQERRGKGGGRALYEELLQRLEDRGYRAGHGAGLGAERGERPAAQGDGFRQVGLHENVGFKHGRWLSVAYFQRALGSGDPPAEPR